MKTIANPWSGLRLTSRSGLVKRQILIYSAVLVPASLLPWALGFAGAVYGATAAICGTILVGLALQLRKSSETDRGAAHRLFLFSIAYLFVLFAALLVNPGGNPWLSISASPDARTAAGSARAGPLAATVQSDRNPVGTRASDI